MEGDHTTIDGSRRRFMQLTAGIAGAAAVGGYAAADTELDDETNEEIDERVAGMSLAEKVGQMTQLDLARLSGEEP